MDYLVKNLIFLTRSSPDRQQDAGSTAGVGQPAISKIIKGTTKEPGYRTVAGLAKHFGVSIDDLVNRDIELDGSGTLSQSVGPDDGSMGQALELLYLMADARPEDRRLQRPTWAMVKVAAKAIQRAEGSPREAMAEILSALAKEV